VTEEGRQKSELIELAALRFSMPRARRMKMKTDEVREAIRSATLDEGSLGIVSHEAQRSGMRRSS